MSHNPGFTNAVGGVAVLVSWPRNFPVVSNAPMVPSPKFPTRTAPALSVEAAQSPFGFSCPTRSHNGLPRTSEARKVVRDEDLTLTRSQMLSPRKHGSVHGRGIYLMKALMDEVRFEEGGVVVRMRKNAGPAAAKDAQKNSLE
jgi:hypothetical protein